MRKGEAPGGIDPKQGRQWQLGGDTRRADHRCPGRERRVDRQERSAQGGRDASGCRRYSVYLTPTAVQGRTPAVHAPGILPLRRRLVGRVHEPADSPCAFRAQGATGGRVTRRTAARPARVVALRSTVSSAGDPPGGGMTSSADIGLSRTLTAIPAASVPGSSVKGAGWKNRHGSAMSASFVNHDSRNRSS